MLEYKENLKSKVLEKFKTDKIINFYDLAKENGYKHIKTNDVFDIVKAVEKSENNIKAVKMTDNINSSLFTSLYFIDKSLKFD